MISCANQIVDLSLISFFPFTSCWLNAQSGSCPGNVHIATFVGTWMSLKCPDLVFHAAPAAPSTSRRWKSVSLCREWSSLGHVVNSSFVGIVGDATSCVSSSVCVLTCSSWMMSSCRTMRPRPVSGSAFVGITCQWLFTSSCA